eukprot:TRINITY_DN13500_c0_g1_i1.p1 TRINITY_DN13500_c0_g1~~TRINITY_DN13500_c0_g1_i1.p1  ORF type:complete len:169 (-),score=33.19 TRINITY_DN13500_c0_g1_i1:157-663(-)
MSASALNEQTYYVPVRPAGAQPGEWRYGGAGNVNMTQQIVKCPKCEHAVIVPYYWDPRWATAPVNLHCKGCGWHKTLQATRDQDEVAEINKIIGTQNLYYSTLFEGNLLWARNRDIIMLYIDFIGGTHAAQPGNGSSNPLAHLPSWVLSADKKKMIRALEKLLELPKP